MLLELFPFVILNHAKAFVYAYFFSDFLCFDMSLLLLTVTQRGYLISIAYSLFFSLNLYSNQFPLRLLLFSYYPLTHITQICPASSTPVLP